MTEKEQLDTDLAEFRRLMAILSDNSREAATDMLRTIAKEEKDGSGN